MEIKKITRYKLNGVEYPDLAKMREHCENQLGAIIDKFDVTLTPKQKLNILNGLTANHVELRKWLSVSYISEAENVLNDSPANILNYE